MSGKENDKGATTPPRSEGNAGGTKDAYDAGSLQAKASETKLGKDANNGQGKY